MTRKGTQSIAFRFLAVAFLLMETAILAVKAKAKPFWWDEMLTYYISIQGSLSRVLEALDTGIDATPPAYYVLLHVSKILPIADPHIQLRVVSILGYLLTLTGVYLFSSRRWNPWAASAAVLFLALTPFRDYAVEARPYAAVVGFFAMAAACWQRIGESRWAAPGFAVFLTAGVAMHHLAVAVLGCFGLAELAWSVVRRKIRWQTCGGMALAVIPFVAALPALFRFKSLYQGGAIVPPGWGVMFSTYSAYTGLSLHLILGAITACVLVIGMGAWAWTRSGRGANQWVVPESLLILSFLAFPALLVAMVRLSGGVYTPRYGWSVIIGVGLVVALLAGALRTKAVLCLVAGLAFGCMLQALLDWKGRNDEWKELYAMLGQLEQWRQRKPELPLVQADGFQQMLIHRYGEEPLKRATVQLMDMPLLIKYQGSPGVDMSNWLLRKYIPLPMAQRKDFLAAHNRFLLCSTRNTRNWLERYLRHEGYRMEMLDDGSWGILFLVER